MRLFSSQRPLSPLNRPVLSLFFVLQDEVYQTQIPLERATGLITSVFSIKPRRLHALRIVVFAKCGWGPEKILPVGPSASCSVAPMHTFSLRHRHENGGTSQCRRAAAPSSRIGHMAATLSPRAGQHVFLPSSRRTLHPSPWVRRARSHAAIKVTASTSQEGPRLCHLDPFPQRRHDRLFRRH